MLAFPTEFSTDDTEQVGSRLLNCIQETHGPNLGWDSDYTE
jgi:hypothetical protein